MIAIIRLSRLLHKTYRRVIKLWRRHFPLITLFLLVLVLAVAFISQGRNWIISLFFCTTGISSFIIFYGTYVLKFKKLTDLSSHREYYYNLYNWWGITFFNFMFIALFAFVLFFLNSNLSSILLPTNTVNPIFLNVNSVDPFPILILLIEQIVDTVTLGTLAAYKIKFVNLEVNDFWIEKTIFHLCKILIEVFVITSIGYHISQRREIHKELNRLKIEDLGKGSILKNLDPLKVKLSLNYLQKNWDNHALRKRILDFLQNSRSIEVRDIFLKVLDQTSDLEDFEASIEYFMENNDSRFSRVVRKIRDPQKRAILMKKGLIKR